MLATFRVMLLAFLRDPAGWVLTLLLPPLVYAIFASVFGAGASGALDYSIAVADTVQTPLTRALVQRVGQEPGQRVVDFGRDVDGWRRAVSESRADVGLLIRPPIGEAKTPLLVLYNRNRRVVADVFTVRLDRLVAAGHADAHPATTPAPAVASASRSAADDSAASASGARMSHPHGDGATDSLASAPRATAASPEIATEALGPARNPQAAYYAGAVSILFAFFSAVHAAMGGIDDRRSGIAARSALLAGGALPILFGRMGWLTVQGLLQATVVFSVGTLALGIDAFARPLAWLLTAALSSAVAASAALALTSLCESRKQAEPLTTFVLLVAAALGGSMAPRFLMPHAFQLAGWFTPHAWAIETYLSVVWRHVVDADVIEGWLVLAGITGSALAIASIAERRRLAS